MLGVKFEHKIDRIEVDNQIAWVVGPYTVTIPSKEGGSTQINGNFLHVLRQEGGTWKLQAASFTRTKSTQEGMSYGACHSVTRSARISNEFMAGCG